MDFTRHTPLVDALRRGEVPADIRMLAARGVLTGHPIDQLTLLVVTHDDREEAVATAARDTLSRIPRDQLAAQLAREDVPHEVRTFFAARGIGPSAAPPADPDVPLVRQDDESLPEADTAAADDAEPSAGDDAVRAPARPPLSSLPVTDRVKLAMRGTREQRSALVRDSSRLVAVAVLSSPKLSESEVEVFARMANVSDEVLRIIGTNRAWTRSYAVTSALVRNPRTPPAISQTLAHRLNDRDLKLLAVDRNVPDGLRLAARKLVAAGESRRK